MNPRSHLVALTAAVLIFGTAAAVEAQQVGVGIGLEDPPETADERARSYIVEHASPGDRFTRFVRVVNEGSEAATIDVYAVAARVDGGDFLPVEDASTQLLEWISLDTSSLLLEAGGSAPVGVRFDVDDDASTGEHLGAVFAEVRSTTDGAELRSRVGVRIYLSIGEGGAPSPNFSIVSMAPGRGDDGVAFVDVGVENTGGRAIDVRGSLSLGDGPGGLSRAPVELDRAFTATPSQRVTLRFTLGSELPAGPWLARADLQSGLIERSATAVITFPEAGEIADPVPADVVEQRRILLPIASGLLGIALVLLALLAVTRRRLVPDALTSPHEGDREAVGDHL